MRNLRLVLNGKSAGDPEVRSAVEAARSAGHAVDVRVTWEAGQATTFAAEAVQQGVEVIVAGGGDGTVNEVTQGLLQLDNRQQAETIAGPTLAVLPLGTANDLARSLSLPLGDPLAALTLAAEGPIGTIDVGLANGRPFVNVASGGFGAEVTSRTSPGLKDAIGGAAYSITALMAAPQLTPYPCRVVAEGRALDLSIALLAIGNGQMAGGGFSVAPQARFDDGLLDLVIVPAVPLGDWTTLVRELFNLSDENNQHILYRQLAQFELHFAKDFQLNLDGEPLVDRHFQLQVLPRALRIVRP